MVWFKQSSFSLVLKGLLIIDLKHWGWFHVPLTCGLTVDPLLLPLQVLLQALQLPLVCVLQLPLSAAQLRLRLRKQALPEQL